jgi:ABC-type polysaccharide/polyol phosphate export permease
VSTLLSRLPPAPGGAGDSNPIPHVAVTTFIGVVRTAVLDGQAPSATQLGLMALWVSIALGASLLVFMRYQPRFAEEL